MVGRDCYSFRGFSGCCELTDDIVDDVAEVSPRCLGEDVEGGCYWVGGLG